MKFSSPFGHGSHARLAFARAMGGAALAILLCGFVGPDEADEGEGALPPSEFTAPQSRPQIRPDDPAMELRAPRPSAQAGTDKTQPAEPESARPAKPMDPRGRLEALFSALSLAPDAESAQMIGDRLDRLFAETGSPAIDLLMSRATAALHAKQNDLALNLLDQAIDIEPDALGLRARRATLHYLRDDFGAALADIREVLAREPRHFTMLYAFALILKDMGEDKLALEAVRKALVVNPQFESAREMERQLTLTVEGREA
ncbi:hypothetical protein ACT6QG_08365 [Xanthobacter sp. TB0136]|uniref:hypothetical protein n=1 Tax=Xanthobacter sp. TB0136 TaxID=3459177 RepID=UPI004039FF8F